MKNPLIPKNPKKIKAIELPHSAGILDDFAVRKNVATKEGTIEKVPVNNSDIVNKKYVDDAIDTDIATHKADASAHHTKYTNAEAVAAVEAAGYFKNQTDIIHNSISGLNDGDNYKHLTATEKANAATAYSHSQNNSQAHSDYMLNTGDTATGDYNFDSGTLFVDSINNRIGIGTTNPGESADADFGPMLQVKSTTAHVDYWSGRVVGGGPSNAVTMGELNGLAQIGGHNAELTDWSNLIINAGGGYVGIGTSNPADRLDVYNGGLRVGDASVQGFLSYDDTDVKLGSVGDYDLKLYTNSTEKMRITSDGKVGIGTTGPGLRAEVRGTGGGPATSGTTQTGIMRFSQSAGTLVMDTGIGAASGNNAWLQVTNSAGLGNYYSLLLNPNGGNVGIGTTSPTTSAKLEINSTTGALLLSRMTTTQRNALTAVNGMLIYNSTDNKFQGYENGAWVNLI